jgi:hypothetical protein
MSFLRHDGIYRSDVAAETATTWGRVPPPVGRPRAPVQRTRREELRALLIVRDEFRPAIPRSGCSPAEPVSASPATSGCTQRRSGDNGKSAGGKLSKDSVSHPRGALHLFATKCLGKLPKTPRRRVFPSARGPLEALLSGSWRTICERTLAGPPGHERSLWW